MLGVYEEIIMEATGVIMPDDLKEIEDIMRGESGGTLNHLERSELVSLAKDAKEAFEIIKGLGA